MLAAFSITPLGARESVGGLVAEAVRVVRQSGLPKDVDRTVALRLLDEPIAAVRVRRSGTRAVGASPSPRCHPAQDVIVPL